MNLNSETDTDTLNVQHSAHIKFSQDNLAISLC